MHNTTMKQIKIIPLPAIILAIAFPTFSVHAEMANHIANHIVISQIQTDSKIGSGGTADDFVELYNPTSSAVDLSSWSLQRRAHSGALAKIELAGQIPARGFYLIVRGSATTSLTSLADKTFSLGIAFNNDDAFLLVNNTSTVSDINDPDIVDLVGTGLNEWFETAAAPNAPEAQALLRKSGAAHIPAQGNGWDSNNNSADFILTSPNPRNTASAVETPPPPPPPSDPEPEPPSLGAQIKAKITEGLNHLKEKFANLFD